MKTTNIKLLAMMFTLAAVISVTSPANAQRRNTDSKKADRTEKSESIRKNTIQNKNTTQNQEARPKSTSRNQVNNSSDVKRKNSSDDRDKSSRNNKTIISEGNSRSSNSEKRSNSATVNPNRNSQEKSRKQSVQNSRKPDYNNSDNRKRSNANSSGIRRNNQSNTSGRRSGTSSVSTPNNRVETRSITGRTKIDENDRRYTPNRDYRGSSNYWSDRDRPSKMNYNHTDRNFWRNYNYNKYHHWDNRWENYRWSANSWRDYYRGYNPYSFRYNKHYYFDNTYGHVLRRFAFRPIVFLHNHHKYYCYDGHFFRYYRGIGYVLVDIPYGFAFDYLPGDFQRVYINGYLYFRVGNMFFEYNDYGYSLIHYPERYFAIDAEFANGDIIYNDYY